MSGRAGPGRLGDQVIGNLVPGKRERQARHKARKKRGPRNALGAEQHDGRARPGETGDEAGRGLLLAGRERANEGMCQSFAGFAVPGRLLDDLRHADARGRIGGAHRIGDVERDDGIRFNDEDVEHSAGLSPILLHDTRYRDVGINM